MRIRDWSSAVCSSVLVEPAVRRADAARAPRHDPAGRDRHGHRQSRRHDRAGRPRPDPARRPGRPDPGAPSRRRRAGGAPGVARRRAGDVMAQPGRTAKKLSPDGPGIHPEANVVASTFGAWTEVGARTSVVESTMDDYSNVVPDSQITHPALATFA